MHVIHKYPLGIGGTEQIELPLGAVPVHVGMQGEQLCLWVLKPLDALSSKAHHFQVVGTGEAFPLGHVYIGTAQHGPFVWHVVETP